MDDQSLLRYSRHIMLPEIDIAGQQALLQARAVIIGIGGLGSVISMYLAAAGVGELVLVDFDTVELSNLQRQIVHSSADLERLKVDSARTRLLALNPSIKITTIDQMLTGDALTDVVQRADVVLDACDNFKTRFALNQSCYRTRTPMVCGAAIRFEGQISVFDHRDYMSPCYRCLYQEDAAVTETCTDNGVLAPLLGVIGSLQASEALKIIMGIGESLQGKLLLVDLLHNDWHTAKLPKDPDCPVCHLRKQPQ